MAGTRLMAHIAYEHITVSKTCSEFLSLREFAAAIAANVDNEAVAHGEVGEDIVDIARAEFVLESAKVDVADVVVENLVVHAAGYAVVAALAQILSLNLMREIGGVVLFPRPAAREVERGGEIDVTVLQGAEHIAQKLKELAVGHLAVCL